MGNSSTRRAGIDLSRQSEVISKQVRRQLSLSRSTEAFLAADARQETPSVVVECRPWLVSPVPFGPPRMHLLLPLLAPRIQRVVENHPVLEHLVVVREDTR